MAPLDDRLEREPRFGRRDADSWVVGIATLGVNVGSFLFLVLVARNTSPAVFGALAALVGLTLAFEVPANSLRTLVARWLWSSRRSDGLALPTVATGLLADTAVWGVLVSAGLLAVSPVVKWFFHLPSITPALLLGAYALPVALGVVPKGMLLAEGRAKLLGGALVGIGVRLCVGVVLVDQGAGLDGALAAMVIGEVVATGVCLYATRADLVTASPKAGAEPDEGASALGAPAGASALGAPTGPRRVMRWRDARGLVLTFTGYWLFEAVDMVLARHWLSAPASGWYAAAMTTAQVAMLAPGAAAAVIFSRLLGEENNATRRLTLVKVTAAVAGSGLAVATVVSVFAELVVTNLFDASYKPSTAVAGLLSIAGALLGLITVLLYYNLARGWQKAANVPWAGLVASIAGIAIWHRDMTEVAVVTVATMGAVAGSMLAMALARSERPGPEFAQRAQLALADADIDLTVVVPYYNPGDLLVPTVGRILSALEASGATYEVIAVSDGSTDGSDEALDQAFGDRAELTNIVLSSNQGKGAALHVGLAKGRGRYLGFIDADGDLDPLLLRSFHATVEAERPDVVLGSKRHPGSEVYYPPLRRLYSWGYQQIVRIGFRLNLRDTQTGIKLVRRDVVAAVLPRMLEKRFAFDLELFVVARRLGYHHFIEAPIKLQHQFKSTVSWRSVWPMLLDTAAIWYRLRILHYYDAEAAPATPIDERLRLEPLIMHGSAGLLTPAPTKVRGGAPGSRLANGGSSAGAGSAPPRD